MKSLFQPDGYNEIRVRLTSLQSTAQSQWGKMDAAQMLAHCCRTMEVAAGQKHIPYTLLGKLIGRFFKASYIGKQPFSRNSPTDKHFLVVEPKDFAKEKARLLDLVKQFAEGGEATCTRRPHSFFGPLSPAEWGISQYKHLDHQLRQFGA